MDLSALTSGGQAETAAQSQIEYDAQLSSPLVNGEAKLSVGEDALQITALFDAAELPYADMLALSLADYRVCIRTAEGNYTFSHLGQWGQPFYDALYDAYNKKVLKSLFVEGKPLVTADNGAPVEVYENCVCQLPPDIGAKRVPLCFVNALQKNDYTLTLRLDTGESYSFAKLGYATEPFADTIEKQIRKLREKALVAVKELDPTLTATQAARIAKLMPVGAAAPIGQLAAIAPAFVTAIEAKIAESRAAETYQVFRQICDPALIYVGFKKNEAPTEGEAPTGLLGALSGGGNPLAALGNLLGGGEASAEGEEAPPPDPYMLWLIAPSADGRFCAVEFAGEANDAAATFVYSCPGGFESFAAQLNQALEAISFKREIIRLSDAELQKAENADKRMAIQRNTALQLVRANFKGRAIHRNLESWQRELLSYMR